MPSQPSSQPQPNQISQVELDLAVIQGTGNGFIYKVFKAIIFLFCFGTLAMLFSLIFNNLWR